MDEKEATIQQINGHQIYYERSGNISQPAVILLHHGLGSVSSWKYQVPALLKVGFQVVAYDRWGYGQSDSRIGLYVPHFEDDLDDLHELLARLELYQAALVGHSDGGTISLYFADLYPIMVWGLATIAAHIYTEPKMAPGIENVRKSFENDTGFRDGLKRMHGEKTQMVFNNWYQAWMQPKNIDWDMRDNLHGIKCKSLIIQGIEDEHATPKHAQDIVNEMDHAELWLVPNANHMLPQENPQLINERIVSFLSECWSNQKDIGH